MPASRSRRSRLRLDWDDDSPFKQTLLALAPDGPGAAADRRRLCRLGHAGDRRVPGRALSRQAALAARPKQRARARSLCAEMHAGFGALRSTFAHEHRGARCPRSARACCARSPAVARDLQRIDAMWDEALEASGGPVPVRRLQHRRRLLRAGLRRASRTYGLPLSAPSAGLRRAHPGAAGVRSRGSASALAEHDFIAEDEPYRKRPELSDRPAPERGSRRAGPDCHEALPRRRRSSRRAARPAGQRPRLGRRRRRRRRSCVAAGYQAGRRGLPGVPASRDARGARPRAHRAQDRRPAIAASPSTPRPRSRSRRTCCAAT